MIVKNEELVIKRCLDSVKHLIDSWCIIDTGSSDNTIKIIQQELSEINGLVHYKKWVNFGFNRSEAIALASEFGSDYLLLVDADNEVINLEFNKGELSSDLYYARHVGDLDYARAILVKTNLNWQYIGSTHEFIDSSLAKSFDTIQTLKYRSHYDGASRKNKFSRDIALLLESLSFDENNSRTVFYLAQSYKDNGNFSDAIKWYERRVEMKGWQEEVWYSKYQIASIYEQINANWNIVLEKYIDAYEYRPTRAEPLYKICRHYRINKSYFIAKIFGERALSLPYPKDYLFIERSIYEKHLLDEMSIVYYYTGEFDKSIELCINLLSDKDLSENDRKRIENNMEFSINKCQR